MENDLYEREYLPFPRRGVSQADLRIAMLMAIAAVVLASILF